MNEKCFYNLLLICSAVAFFTSIVLSCWNINHFESIKNNLTTSIQNLPTSNKTETLEKLIDWQGQGTISWGLGFLASITVFFTILLTLRNKDKPLVSEAKKRIQEETNRINFALSCLALLFFFASIVSVFELLLYYRIVATLQSLMPVAVPPGLLYDFIISNGGEYVMIILSGIAFFGFLIFFSWKEKPSFYKRIANFVTQKREKRK
jgi:hypothetical protein